MSEIKTDAIMKCLNRKSIPVLDALNAGRELKSILDENTALKARIKELEGQTRSAKYTGMFVCPNCRKLVSSFGGKCDICGYQKGTTQDTKADNCPSCGSSEIQRCGGDSYCKVCARHWATGKGQDTKADECPECDGHGFIDFQGLDCGGSIEQVTGKCRVCNGTGTVAPPEK
jgi:hypothetical protein